jgi:hypothetical protein
MKFRTNRRHLPAPVPVQLHHPIYDIQSKRHFGQNFSTHMTWRPSLRIVTPLKPQRDFGMQKLIEDITIVKPKMERMPFMGSRGHSTVLGKHQEGSPTLDGPQARKDPDG